MSLLTHPPEVSVGTVEEVLAVAYAMEREATERYAALARCMRRVRHDDIAAVFEGLAAEEERHLQRVEHLAHKLLHRLPDPHVVRWELPETMLTEAEAGLSALTPYKALSIAVRNEERAFAFWTYVAADADALPAVRAQAEAMARQELLHAAMLRNERRRAYHAERAHRQPDQDAGPLPDDAAGRAAQLEAEAAAFFRVAAARLDVLNDTASAQLLRQIADEMARHDPAPPPPTAAQKRAADALAGGGSAALLFECAGILERLAHRYVGWLGRNADPALAVIVEPLAHAASAWLQRVNARLFAVEPALAGLADRSSGEDQPE